ncbi:hypothetical protein [Bradyrhizobium sp. SZCCHNRI2049]|uniref:hypothetical protein n=1 Tax=Bradyrhizobium sp. SZCCHNRI2049 TaxID=3057287 RepID=UPI002915CEBE|nr:hypothetical protein [Bradyrhizobium sp. SZCCHNRI2049]
MTTILQAYDRARAALAEISTVNDVLTIRDELEHVKLYANQINDRALLAEATTLQLRAERRLGFLLKEAFDAGHLARGRKPKPGPEAEAVTRVTLEEIGVDKKLSMAAQAAARMAEEQFEALIEDTVTRLRARKAIAIDALAQGSSQGPINGSRAVMSSRVEPDDSLDYFPTPPWAVRALMTHVMPLLIDDAGEFTAWEPACGEGHIAEVLREFFGDVTATDIFEHGYGEVLDFLSNEAKFYRADWIITNPPFGDLAEAFTLRALEMARFGVAMFVRLQWLEGIGRYTEIFAKHPPTIIAFFAERVNLCKGRWDPEGGTATAYIWLVWDKREQPRPPFWIPPGRRDELTKPDDVERFTAQPVRKRVRAQTEGEAA